MIAIGSVLAAIAIGFGARAFRPDSAVERRLALLLPVSRAAPRWRPVHDRDLRQARLLRSQTQLLAAKVLAAIVAAMAGALGGGPLGAAVPGALGGAYLGSIAPSLVVERRARSARQRAERAIGPFLERLEALAAAGRPVESAVASLARLPTGAPLLDAALRSAADAYVLGAPLFAALAGAAREEAIDGLAGLAAALERSRDLGRGSLAVIRDARDAARAAERTASLEAAARVEGRLMLTLVLCYLPALMLLVVIPLFLTLLDGLFG